MKWVSRNIDVITSFIVGGVIFGGISIVAAYVFLAKEVDYIPPNGITSSATNVKKALDELYYLVDPDNMGKPLYYEFGTPTTLSSTTPISSSSHMVFLGLYEDNQYGVCYASFGVVCFRYNNWIAESQHIQNAFSSGSCTVSTDKVVCRTANSGITCGVYSNGEVACDDNAYFIQGCWVNSNGSLGCY